LLEAVWITYRVGVILMVKRYKNLVNGDAIVPLFVWSDRWQISGLRFQVLFSIISQRSNPCQDKLAKNRLLIVTALFNYKPYY
ncbi:MAG: hypothetical protein RIB86_20760, partial [Imperialibacter sp.]